MENTFQEQNDMLKAVHQIPVGLTIFKYDGKVIRQVYSNHVLAKAMGYNLSQEEKFTMAEDILNVILGKDRERIITSIKEAIVRKETLDIQLSLIKENNELMPVHIMGNVVLDDLGNYMIYATIAPQSNELGLFNKLSSFSNEGIYVVDIQTHELLYANAFMNRFLKDHNYKGKPCYKAFLGFDDICPYCKVLNDCGNGKEKEFFSLDYNTYFSVRAEDLIWGERKAKVAFIRDISEEKILEVEKKKLYKNYISVVNNSPGGIISLDVNKKTKNFKINFVNDSFLNILEITRESFYESYSNNIFGGMHPDDIEANREAIRLLTEEGAPYNTMYRLINGKGKYVWLKVNAIAIDNGNYFTIYCGYLDMTEIAEKKKRQKRNFSL